MLSLTRSTLARSSRAVVTRALSTSAPARPLTAVPVAAARSWLVSSPSGRQTINALVEKSRAFSSSVPAQSAAESDTDLASRLAEELKYEQEADPSSFEGGPEPEFITEFKKKGVWSIQESTGNEEVTLTRTFGNETIKLIFAVSDLEHDADAQNDGFPDFNEEEGEEDLDDDIAEKRDAPPKKSGKFGTRSFSTSAVRPAPENVQDVADDMFTDPEGEEGDLPPIRCAITVTKGEGQGALTVDAIAEDGDWTVESIAFYKDPKLATELSADADWTRRGIYSGPQFGHLDNNLQQSFGEFLENRGIDTDLSMFIPELAEWKEQKEYATWLKNVKDWVEN